jgi:hypothetical protein
VSPILATPLMCVGVCAMVHASTMTNVTTVLHVMGLSPCVLARVSVSGVMGPMSYE